MAGEIFLGGAVRPGGPFAIARQGEIRGGLHVVADVAARDAIIDDVLEIGMLVYTISENKTWRLVSTGPSVWVWTEEEGGVAGIVSWTANKTWAEVYAEIVANGGDATVVCGDNLDFLPGTFEIPAGTYDINKVRFFSTVGNAAFSILSGATFTPNIFGQVSLITCNVSIFTEAAIVAPGASVYFGVEGIGGLFHFSNTTPAFPLCASFQVFALHIGVAIRCLYFNGTAPVVTIASGGFANLGIDGPGYIGKDGCIAGGPGTAYLTTDADAAYFIRPGLLGGSLTYVAGYPLVLSSAVAAPINGTIALPGPAPSLLRDGVLGQHPSGRLQIIKALQWFDVGTAIPIGIQPEAPTGLVVRYVRSTGNDTTGDGLTALTAYLTPERAREDCPYELNGNTFRIDMTGYGTYTPVNPFVFPAIHGNITNWSSYGFEAEAQAFGNWQRADFELYAEPTLLAGPFIAGAYTDASDGTAALHTVVTVPGATWTVDQWVGKLFIVKGYQPSRIISNTANTLRCTMYQNFTGGFSAFADAFIATESCTIDLATAGWWFASIGWQRIAEFSLTVAGFNFTNGYYADLGLKTPFTTYIACNNLGVANYSDYLVLYGCHLVTYFLAKCRNGADMYYCTYADLGIHSNENGFLTVTGCYGTGGDSIGEGAYHGEYASNHQARTVGVFGTTHRDTGRGGVRLVSKGGVAVVGYCVFENCGYGAIRLEESANCLVIGRIAGTGNGANVGGHGAYVLDGSQLQIGTIEDVSPNAALDQTNVTITGPNGDIIIGDSIYPGVPSMFPVRSWTSFFTQYPKKLHSNPLGGGSRVYQRNGDTDTSLYLPKLATVDIPAPAVANNRMMIFDTDVARAKISNGAYWTEVKHNVFVWPVARSWADLWAEIQSCGGEGIVLLTDKSAYTIPAGSYDFSKILFRATATDVVLFLSTGVLLDAGANVFLNLDAVLAVAFAALMATGGSKPVQITLRNDAGIDNLTASPLFDSSSTFCSIYSNGGAVLSDGGGPLLHLTGAGHAVLEMIGSNPTYGPFGGPAFAVAVITGTLGTDVVALFDALTQHQFNQAIVLPPPLVVTTTGSGGVSLTRYATGAIPAPIPANKGQVAYDTTLDVPKYSTGAAWRTFSGGVYRWTTAKTWAQLWAEVQAGGGIGVIYVDLPASPTRTITAAEGPYDFTGIEFRFLPEFGPSSVNTVTFAAGTLIDAGTKVVLRARGPGRFVASTALMTADANKQVILDFAEQNGLSTTADVTLFRSTFAGQHALYLRSGRIATSANVTNPFFYVNNATGTVQVFYEALSSNNAGYTSFAGNFAGGISGSSCIFYGTAFTQSAWRPACVTAPMVTVAPAINSLMFPRFADVTSFPGAPSSQNQGEVGFDILTSGLRMSDGVKWRNLLPYYFNVRDYGAKGDGTTDDGPAIQAACDAASATTGNGRSGIVFFPPCSDSYRVATPVVVALLITGTPAGTFEVRGCGQDSPIKIDLDTTHDAFTFTGGGEWFDGRVRNLTILTSDLDPNNTYDCRTAFKFGASGPGTWIIEDITSIGVWCFGHLIHLLEGYYKISNIHDGGSVCFGADYTYMIHCDGSDLVEFDAIYSFWQHQFRGTVVQNGSARSLIGVTPRDSTNYNGNKDGTKVFGRNLFSNPRNLQLLYCVGDATHIAKSICLEQFYAPCGGNDFIYVDSCDNLELRLGTVNASGANCRYDLGPRIKNFVLDRVQTGAQGGAISILADAGVQHIEVTDSNLDPAVSGAPCGVKLANATATAAFVTTRGLRARVRQLQGTSVANTLARRSTATAGCVAQFATTDPTGAISGAFLDTGVNNDFVRVVEEAGQQVQLKSDGTATIGIGAGVDPSSTSDGRVVEGVGLLGVNAGAAVAATPDALCEVL